MKNNKFTISKITLFVFTLLTLSSVFSQSTRLANSVCSRTINNLGVNLTCNVKLGQGHRFEVSETNGTVVGVYDAISASQLFPGRSRYLFRLNFLSNCAISLGFEYRIRVAWFNGTTWSPYGEYCSVLTPNVDLSLASAFENSTIPSLGSNIRANVNQRCGHRYEVRNTDNSLVGVYDAYQASINFPGRSAYDFRFSWMPFGSIAEGRTYQIRIASFDATSNGWSAYGSTKLIKTPGYGETQLSDEFCGNVYLDSVNTLIEADSLPSALEYLFTITDSNNDTLSTLIKATNSFYFNELQEQYLLEGRVYNVNVRTRRNLGLGFSDPGQTCSLGLRARTTTIESPDCGLTYNYLIQDTLHASPIEGAQGYKFRIFDGVNYIEDTVSNLSNYNGINLIDFPGIQYCKTYLMDVKVLMNDVWGPYGEACQIITVCNPITELRPGFCNATIASCGTNIYAQSILYAQGYQFLVVGGNVNEIVTATSNAGIKLQNLVNVANLTYETNYLIKCRVMVNGVWGAWGEGCNVYLQTNSSLTTYCNQTVPTIGTNVFTSSVGCASDYRFRINGPSVTDFIFNSSMLANCFRFSQVPGVKFNSTYQVEVSVLVGGQWSPFGTACLVNTPVTLSINENNDEVAIESEIKENQTENLASVQSNESLDRQILIYPNPSNDVFEISLGTINSKVTIKVLDNSGRLIESLNIDSSNSNSLSIGNDYPNGAYHLLIESNDLMLSKKIIKISK
jgi:hypothetical protein